MMTGIKIILIHVVVLGVIVSCKPKEQKPAHLRVGQFLISNSNATLTIEKNDSLIRRQTLAFPTLTEYHELQPGRYTFTVSIRNRTILKKEFGIGKDKYFTLCMFGIPDTNLAVNYQTTKDKLHKVFAGAEAHSDNGEMPKFKMLTDNFQKGKDEAQIRWMHLAPGVKSLSAKAGKANKQGSTDFSKANYPQSIENKSLKPGSYIFNWTYDGSPKSICTTRKEIHPDSLYSFFVIGINRNYSDSLEVVSGVTADKNPGN